MRNFNIQSIRRNRCARRFCPIIVLLTVSVIPACNRGAPVDQEKGGVSEIEQQSGLKVPTGARVLKATDGGRRSPTGYVEWTLYCQTVSSFVIRTLHSQHEDFYATNSNTTAVKV